MTIAMDFGDWHIETHRVTISLPDVAGAVEVTINMDRPGRFLWANAVVTEASDNDNLQAVSYISLFPPAAPFTFTFGDAITQTRIRVVKAAGTAGPTDIIIIATLAIRDG